MSINEDIEIAKQIIREKNKERPLHNDSSAVYKATNENMSDPNYIELLKNNKSILSVIGSGDQILNAILFDSLDIDAFDINRFAKYYLEFKMAAVMTLSYEEYLDFFYDNKTFKRNLYHKIVDNMKGEPKEFWDSIADYKGITLGKDKYSPNDVYNSGLFILGIIPQERAIKNNPYLTKENYYLLRNKINEAKIRYYKGNIFGLDRTLDRSYDFINLSNICMYTRDFILPPFGEQKFSNDYKRFVSNLKLNPDGKVLSYLMGYVPGSVAYKYVERSLIDDEDYSIYVVRNNEQVNDALAVYRKRR